MPPAKRSRAGCHACKQARVKCDEIKPTCSSCSKLNKKCDYSMKLTWGGRPYKVSRVEKLNVMDQLCRKQLSQVSKDLKVDNKKMKFITFKMETPNELVQSNKNEDESIVELPEVLSTPIGPDTPKTLAFIDDLLNDNLNQFPLLQETAASPTDLITMSSPVDFSLELEHLDRCNNGALISLPLIDCPSSIRMSPSSSTDDIEPIPRGLMPLPDILLNVPFYYESFQFYMHSTSSIMTPADNSIYIDNPFKIVLPKMAMANEGLMSLLVAFGIWHKAVLEGDLSREVLVQSLVDRALKELFHLLNNSDTATSDLTLALVMMLSSFMVFSLKNSSYWSIHMKGAKQIFLNRGYDKPFSKLLQDTNTTNDNSVIKPKILYFLIRWFAYIDIFTNLSSPLLPTDDEIKQAKNKRNLITIATMEQSQMDYDFDDSTGSLVTMESHQNIDYMLGFNLKIIPILSELCSLIKAVNLFDILGVIPPPSITEKAMKIQQQLNQFQFSIFVPSTTKNHRSINQLIASNQCFLYMGILQLYTRVLKMDTASHLVQSICYNMKFMIENYIDTTSPNSITLILPLFIAGCASLDKQTQTFYLSKLIDLKIRGAINADCAMEIMQHCWQTSENWWTAMIILNKNVVFI